MADPVHIQRLASEIKFLVDHDTGQRLREWARAHLDRDPHGGGAFGDEYATTTLYLDTAEFDVYRRRGSYARSKYRIRRYSGSDLVFIERKMRNADRLAKRRTAMSADALGQLEMNGSHSNGARPGPWPAAWFERRVAARRLAPVCQVSYSRTARIVALAEGPARLTIDNDIGAVRAAGLVFDPDRGCRILNGQVVVEIKYSRQLPALLRRAVEEFRLDPRRSSKYRTAVDALGLAPGESDAQADSYA
jgi:hypothetical protein